MDRRRLARDTQRALSLVEEAFGRPVDNLDSDAAYDLAVAADELVSVVFGGLRRDGISTTAFNAGIELARELQRAIDEAGNTPQKRALANLVDSLRAW